MDLAKVDLNLLVVLGAMAEQRSVTRAAQALGLSQPALSAALARLRRLLDDPLFVRSGAEMKPTPRAQALAGPVQRLLDSVRNDILSAPAFVPAQTERIFTLITPDIGEVQFLPRLLEQLTCAAPRAHLRAIAQSSDAAAQTLASGDADLALGYFPDLQRAGFFQQKLFDSPQVCLLRHDHPLADLPLTQAAFLAAAHAVVRPGGRASLFEAFLATQGLQRRVALELSHYMSLLPVLESSDLIACVPLDLAQVCAAHGRLRVLALPLPAPVVAVFQTWHERVHKDPAHVWLRQLVYDTFSSDVKLQAPQTNPRLRTPAS